MAVAVVALDGSISDVILADPNDPVLAERYPNSLIISVPDNIYPDNTWTYDDTKGFIDPNPPRFDGTTTAKVDF